MIQRLINAWKALTGQPIHETLPPIQLLELTPEDQVILECEKNLSRDQRNELADYMTAWLAGTTTKAVVLTGGVRVVAVRRRPNTRDSRREASG